MEPLAEARPPRNVVAAVAVVPVVDGIAVLVVVVVLVVADADDARGSSHRPLYFRRRPQMMKMQPFFFY